MVVQRMCELRCVTPDTETDQNDQPGGSFDPARHAAITTASQTVGRDGHGPATPVNRGL